LAEWELVEMALNTDRSVPGRGGCFDHGMLTQQVRHKHLGFGCLQVHDLIPAGLRLAHDNS